MNRLGAISDLTKPKKKHEKDQTSKNALYYHQYLSQVFESKPLMKLFRTDTSKYIYDTGTNKILKCEENTFEILENCINKDACSAINDFVLKYGERKFIEVSNEIENIINSESVFLEKKVNNFDLSPHFKNYEDLINSSLEILTLEVTERCNLRCGYCIYNSKVKDKKNHGKRNMCFDIAKKSIDYFNKHTLKSKSSAIGFYGGEPLLNFSLIKSCVEYAKTSIKNRPTNFSITTNGILMNSEIVDFLFKNNFSVLISVDGPKEIHDGYRKYGNGDGSFQETIDGLQKIVRKYGDKAKERIALSIVYAPLFSEKKLDRIAELWQEIPWLQEIEAIISYPSPGSIFIDGKTREEIIYEDKDLREWAYEKYVKSFKNECKRNQIACPIYEKTFAQIMQRPIYNKTCSQYPMNGCCLPAQKKIYVTVDGDMHVCERISSFAPAIGNINNGVDIKAIKNVYFDEYSRISLPICADCWAIRLCKSCYIDVIKDGKMDISTKRSNCFHHKDSYEKDLIQFCSLRETNPNIINKFYDVILL